MKIIDEANALVAAGKLYEAQELLTEAARGCVDPQFWLEVWSSPAGKALLEAWKKNARRSFPVKHRGIRSFDVWIQRFGRRLER